MNTFTDIQQLLPFYVNGTLSNEEKTQVEQAIKDNPALQDEVDFLSTLRSAMKELPQENSPGELGLKRLQRALEKEKLKNNPIARAESKITKEQTGWHWKALAIAACLMLMIQTGFQMNAYYQSGELTAASGPSEAMISVTFTPDATEADIRALLLSLNLTIIDGPSALGIYHLSGGDNLEQTLGILKARTDLVESAQKDGE